MSPKHQQPEHQEHQESSSNNTNKDASIESSETASSQSNAIPSSTQESEETSKQQSQSQTGPNNRRYNKTQSQSQNPNQRPSNNKNYTNYHTQGYQYYANSNQPPYVNGSPFVPTYPNVRYNGYRSNGNGNYKQSNNNQTNRQYNSRQRYNNNGNRRQNYNQHHNNQYQQHQPQSAQVTMSWYSPEVRLQAVSSVAQQIDYYFNISNLLKDMYLRKHMNSQGWIDLKFVSEFYRVRGLSCGDLSVIKDSLDYTQFFEWGYVKQIESSKPEESDKESDKEADSDSDSSNPIENIKIRALTNPLNWVLPESQRVDCGLDERVPVEIQQKPVFETVQVAQVPASVPETTDVETITEN